MDKSKEKKMNQPIKANSPPKNVKVSAALAQIVGSEPMPRTKVTQELWNYIKRNNLQDTKNKRNINPDAKLAKVLGSSAPIDMFQLTSAISQHIHSDTKEPAKLSS